MVLLDLMAAGDTLPGRRLEDGFHYKDAEPGDYWKQQLGSREDPGEKFLWMICDPRGDLGTLTKHEIVEHEDGTISVAPSIQHPTSGGWHGYLESGTWREV